MYIVAEILLFKSPYTTCYISNEQFMLLHKKYNTSIGVKSDIDEFKTVDVSDNELRQENSKKIFKFKTSALFLQPFVKECLNSGVYRGNMIHHLNSLSGNPGEGVIHLKLILEPPDIEIIDYEWNTRMLKLIWSRVEIENAFSWLSTLGGAYSALGDYFEDCAEEAGRISVRQYKLSKMLGDDSLAARSKLYSALAYAQKGNLKLARHIIRNVAAFARSTQDKRLNKMCQGVWVKLKYMKQIQSNKVGITTN